MTRAAIDLAVLLFLLQRVPAPPPGPEAPPAAKVMAAVARAARENAALPEEKRLRGDALADACVRAAAGAAGKDARAFLGGLAAALDVPGARALLGGSRPPETPAEEAVRRRELGEPSMRGRKDLLRHFVASAVLAAANGREFAEAAGIAKEVRDAAPGGSGFSFADLLADLAGVRFAAWLAEGEAGDRLERVARDFRGADFLPDPAGLPEGLSAEAFEKEFGAVGDARFQRKVGVLRDLVAALAVYKEEARPRKE